ncbi:helix-hairpin-helix domain-containing protein [Halopenitus sp. H-Gu1]|uniref:helix-hairpin-helix domain-containing protein n=1 Tax=Halopenitus sp. H-Gu1 TaxID=3242697 RepID=UPI00359F109A
MEFATFRTEAGDDWAEWYCRNVDRTASGVSLAREDTPTWVSPRPLFGTDEAVPPIEGDPIDVAVDACGNRYLLTAAGEVYRHTVGEDSVDELGCLWRPDADPRAIAVTRETIYIAWGDPARVQSYSRSLGSTRRFRSVDDPVDFVRMRDEVHLLDRGERPGSGTVRSLRADGEDEELVTGLYDPIDLAADDAGTLSVLDRTVRDEPAASDRYVVRVFERDVLASPPASAVDAVRVRPRGFRVQDTDDPFVPSTIAVAGTGDLVAGVSPDWDGQRTLMRYRSSEAAFQRQAAFRRGCIRLRAPHGIDELIAIDGDGRVTALEPVHTTVSDGDAGPVGHLSTRLDAGDAGTQWHRISLDADVDGAGTQIRLHYCATDDDRPAPPDADAMEPPDVAAIGGIGPEYARRLREAGIETVRDLAARDVTTVAAILGVEEVNVSTDRAAEWHSAAETLLSEADGEPPDLEAVDGIGPTYAMRLRDAGVDDLADLVALDATVIADLATGELLDVSSERIETWLDRANTMVQDRPALHERDWKSASPANPTEVLLSDAVGRYLWVAVELVGTEYDSPVVRSVEVEAPRQSYLEELPAIYREDEASAAFLEQFLALFESVFTDVETGIEDLTGYLDPQGIPAGPDHLAWLGSWLATETDEQWPEGARRAFIDQASMLYRSRGTRAGLLAAIELYLEYVTVDRPDWDRARSRERARLDELVDEGVLTPETADALWTEYDEIATATDEPLVRVIEHAELDCLSDGAVRVPYDNLLSCSTGFLVLVHPWLDDEHVDTIRRIVEGQEPAHATGRTAGLKRRTILAGADEDDERAGNTYLGINTALPARSFEVDAAGLGQETVLTEREPFGQLDVRGRLGQDTRIP